ncbi:hypothetical protein D9M70_511270 [compost metagenome]
MPDGVAEDLPFACDDAVDKDEPGDRRHHAVIEDVDPPRAADPFQPRIKDGKADKAEPEGGHRIAEQADDADALIEPRAAAGGCKNAERDADQHAEDDAECRHLERRREDTGKVFGNRLAGGNRGAKIAGGDIADIADELGDQRLVEPHFLADALIDHNGRAVADDSENRVDRHDAADEEGDREQAKEGYRERNQEAHQ